jgi:protoheme IX farnesyltransferase
MLLVISVLPFVTGMSGWLYLLGALALGVGFIYWAIVMMVGKKANAGMDTFKYSIIYLMALFVIMLLDHYLITVPAFFP